MLARWSGLVLAQASTADESAVRSVWLVLALTVTCRAVRSPAALVPTVEVSVDRSLARE